MTVAVAMVEAEDDFAVTNLLEALEAGYRVNRGDARCWHIHHKAPGAAAKAEAAFSGFLHLLRDADTERSSSYPCLSDMNREPYRFAHQRNGWSWISFQRGRRAEGIN
jgi:hypothetical protein